MAQQQVPTNDAAAESFMQLLSTMQAVSDATIGFYKTLIDGGIPKDVAAEMSQRFSQAILDMMVGGVMNSRPKGRPW